MWAEATFQVDLLTTGGRDESEWSVIEGFPGIGPLSIDEGRQLVIVRYDPERWTPATLAAVIEDLTLPWRWLPPAAV